MQFGSDAASTAWRRACTDLRSGHLLDEVGAEFFHTMAKDDDRNEYLVAMANIPTVNALRVRELSRRSVGGLSQRTTKESAD